MKKYEGTYVIYGPPGTGKTTFLKRQIEEIYNQWITPMGTLHPNPILVCSLTRAAAAEIAGRRLPIRREMIGTLHAHAYHSLGVPPIAETKLDEWNKENPLLQLTDIKTDVDEPYERRETTRKTEELFELYQLKRQQMSSRQSWTSTLTAFADKWEAWKRKTGYIDFTDMIEIALEDVPIAPHKPIAIFADEAQDLSAMEFALLKKWGAAAEIMFIAGDADQALYVWRGAHPQIFRELLEEGKPFKILGQSYRVPKRILTASMRWREKISDRIDIEYKPTDIEGSIEKLNASWKYLDAAIAVAEKEIEQGKVVMFQASCGYMLDCLIRALRKRGLPFCNPQRKKRGDWNPMRGSTLNRVKDFLRADYEIYKDNTRYWNNQELANWLQLTKKTGLILRGEFSEFAVLAEKFPKEVKWLDELNLFEQTPLGELKKLVHDSADGIKTHWIDWLLKYARKEKTRQLEYLSAVEKKDIKQLYKEPPIKVGTIHSFKGGECDVAIIFPDLSLSGFIAWNKPGIERDGVARMFYVALTRAREKIYICNNQSSCAVDLSCALN